VTAQQARPVGFGWFMALAPESLESWPAAANHALGLHRRRDRMQSWRFHAHSQPLDAYFVSGLRDSTGGGGPKATIDRLVHSAGSSAPLLDYSTPAVTGGAACTPLGKATVIRLHTDDVVPGSRICSPPELCPPWDMPRRLGTMIIKATVPTPSLFPVEPRTTALGFLPGYVRRCGR
jgi:hypothetical protein